MSLAFAEPSMGLQPLPRPPHGTQHGTARPRSRPPGLHASRHCLTPVRRGARPQGPGQGLLARPGCLHLPLSDGASQTRSFRFATG